LQRFDVQPGFFMSALYLEALAGNAASLSVLMAGAWVVQQPAGNSGSGWGLALFARPGRRRKPLMAGRWRAVQCRQRRYRDRQLRISRLFLPPA
jgi:hypothetical protein